MKITKLEHSGIAVENAGKILLCDPVEYETRLPNFLNVVGIVITHKHGDHLQPDLIARILTSNPTAKIFTTIDATMLLPNSIIVQNGSVQDIEAFHLEFFGENHAPIVEGKIPCQNIGVLINDTIINPGDSFDLPNKPAKVLLAPIAAPWCKISETMDFVKKAKPATVIPFHDSVLTELGKTFNNNWLKTACDEVGANLEVLKPGASLAV